MLSYVCFLHLLADISSSRAPNNLSQPIGPILLENFCSPQMLHRLISDFDSFVYPLSPLVHRPTCSALLESGAYNSDPVFFRRCLALSAITVASIPSNESEYCGGVYMNIQAMVDRACDLILLSRVATEPTWQDNPTPDILIDSTLLVMAAHYTGRPNRGWSYLNEAIVSIRHLELHHAEGYSTLSQIESELCKRAFWSIYILQV